MVESTMNVPTRGRPNGRPSLANALDDAIRAIDIPPRPQIIDRIRVEVLSENPCFHRIGQLIKADVGLAAGLLKTANSPYFGLRTRVRSVSEALVLLGLELTARAVAAISLRRAFPNSAHYVRFWDSSARIAALSGWLAQTLAPPGLNAADAYTFGLFRDCGIVILLRRFADYRQTLARANGDAERSFTAVEQADYPTDHAVVGSLLATEWWLPEEICQAIRAHHEPSAIACLGADPPLVGSRLIAVSQTAEHLLQQLTGASRTQEWTKLGQASLLLLGLTEESLRELHAEAATILAATD